jgi:hypothetical protein
MWQVKKSAEKWYAERAHDFHTIHQLIMFLATAHFTMKIIIEY